MNGAPAPTRWLEGAEAEMMHTSFSTMWDNPLATALTLNVPCSRPGLTYRLDTIVNGVRASAAIDGRAAVRLNNNMHSIAFSCSIDP